MSCCRYMYKDLAYTILRLFCLYMYILLDSVETVIVLCSPIPAPLYFLLWINNIYKKNIILLNFYFRFFLHHCPSFFTPDSIRSPSVLDISMQTDGRANQILVIAWLWVSLCELSQRIPRLPGLLWRFGQDSRLITSHRYTCEEEGAWFHTDKK